MRVLISGAGGFIGTALSARMLAEGWHVRGTYRNHKIKNYSSGIDVVHVDSFGPESNWKRLLKDIDVVIHLAARAHILKETLSDPLSLYRAVNCAETKYFAGRASVAGVRRFIFISTIGVNGNESRGRPFSETDRPAPHNDYALSKFEAEQRLLELSIETEMEMVVIRSPLVYGSGVKANFLNMMRWLYRGIPLPLGSIKNQRSFIALDNLIDLIVACIDHPQAANQVFLACDGEDLSTTELLKRMGKFLGKPARLIPLPQKLVETGFKLIGKEDLAKRLCGSLQIDISKARNLLGWNPPVSVDDALQHTARFFLESQV